MTHFHSLEFILLTLRAVKKGASLVRYIFSEKQEPPEGKKRKILSNDSHSSQSPVKRKSNDSTTHKSRSCFSIFFPFFLRSKRSKIAFRKMTTNFLSKILTLNFDMEFKLRIPYLLRIVFTRVHSDAAPRQRYWPWLSDISERRWILTVSWAPPEERVAFRIRCRVHHHDTAAPLLLLLPR